MNDDKLSGGRPPSRNPGSDSMRSTPPKTTDEPPQADDGPEDKNEIAARAGELATQSIEHAQRLGTAARERLLRGADERKDSLARGLDGLAKNIDEIGERAGGEPEDLQRRAVDRAAQAVRSVSRALSERSAEELIDEAGRQIRQRPGVFLAGCVALGFLGARLLRR
jgi:hypothetical protein